MSVAYEPRNFLHEGTYPPIGDEPDHAADQRFTDSEVVEHLSHYTADAAILPDDRGVMGDERDMLVEDDSVIHDASQLDLNVPGFSSPLQVPLHVALSEPMPEVKLSPPVAPHHPLPADYPSPLPHPGQHPHSHPQPHPQALPLPQTQQPPSSRVKPIPKPNRQVHKATDGKFHCPLSDCKEELRSFARKCEWNKHMDKHERPYRCAAEGCENLPGFTYSGGLLRHEREVHGKHGGPKKTVNCPHPNCKRNSGKGFSRQENLNEHLRRVHTMLESATPPVEGPLSPDDDSSVKSGTKRKRSGSDYDEVAELREELKRTREENEKLKMQLEQQSQQSLAMMAEISQLQEALRHGIAPTAHML